jgi:hypothetical protein
MAPAPGEVAVDDGPPLPPPPNPPPCPCWRGLLEEEEGALVPLNSCTATPAAAVASLGECPALMAAARAAEKREFKNRASSAGAILPVS